MRTFSTQALAAASLIGLMAAASVAQPQYRIETIAGQPAPVNVPPTNTFLQAPQGLAFDGQGNFYIVQVDAGILSMVSAATGNITTVAGSGGANSAAGFGGPATRAAFPGLRYVAFDSTGNIFLTDWVSCTVDRIDAVTKIVTLYAGITGSCGYSGDGGPATSAQLSANTRTIALDSAGNLYIADTFNRLVRRVDATTHIITTYAGGGSGYGEGGPATSANINPFALTFDSAGNLYIGGQSRIRVVNKTTGIITTFAGTGAQSPVIENAPAASANLGNIRGLAFDSLGNLYFTDNFNLRLRKIDNSVRHLVTTIAGTGASGYSGDGGPATNALMTDLEGVAVDARRDVYFSDFTAHVVRKVTGTKISTYAGSLGPDDTAPTSAFLNSPQDVAVDAFGNILVSDLDDARIHKINPALTNLQSIAGLGYAGNTGDGGLATKAALGYGVQGVTLDPSGNIYVADFGNFVVRKIDAGGVISVFAGNGTSGNSGDGGLATSAQLSGPQFIAIDSTGAVYIEDGLNNNIRKVDLTGHISTIAGTGTPGFSPDGTLATAAQLNSPSALAFDSANNLYIADYGNSLVRVINASDAKIYTIAGNGNAGYTGDGHLATAAQLNAPQGLAVNANGDVFIADNGNHAIRLVTASTGIIQTIAGTGVAGFSGDGGNASAAHLHSPIGLALDANERLLVADNGNSVIRRLTPKAVPAITWPAPAAITYGKALGSGQLDATANVPGKFVYTPAAGTVLQPGSQTLSVIFTPSDRADYTTATASTSIIVNEAVLTVSANNLSRSFGAANPTLTASITGFVNGDPSTVVSGSPALATAATLTSLPGPYPITVGLGTLLATNYSFHLVPGTLTVTGTSPSSGSKCNGAYNGTFNGNLTVSTGQNCTFVNGGVSGNVQLNGGNLTLIQARVGGNVQLGGAATFSIGPGSTIGGNLQVQGLSSGSGQNQVCGTTVQGDLLFQNNGTAVLLGAVAPASCAGNTIDGYLTIQSNLASASVVGNTVGKDLTVQNNSAATIVDGNSVGGSLTDQNNTAATQVFHNVVGNNLQCRQNSAITGGGNTAKSKQGQCAAF